MNGNDRLRVGILRGLDGARNAEVAVHQHSIKYRNVKRVDGVDIVVLAVGVCPGTGTPKAPVGGLSEFRQPERQKRLPVCPCNPCP